MSKRPSELQKLAREVNFMKLRLSCARRAIQDAWSLIDHMDPSRIYPSTRITEGIKYMFERLERGYQAAKKELQHGQK